MFPLVRLHKKLLQRIAGVLLWMGRPLSGGNLFLFPLFLHMYHPTRHCTPHDRHGVFASNATCRCLFDFGALSWNGWQPTLDNTLAPPTQHTHSLFVDAARPLTSFQVGLFSPSRGCQVYVLPPQIQSQQMAELYALYYGIRLASSLRFPHLNLIGDNKGALSSTLSLHGRASHPIQIKLLRRIFNILWWNRMPVHLFWVPSSLHPGDPPSRLEPSTSTIFHTLLLAQSRFTILSSSHPPAYFGTLTL